jgi:phage shock protein A
MPDSPLASRSRRRRARPRRVDAEPAGVLPELDAVYLGHVDTVRQARMAVARLATKRKQLEMEILRLQQLSPEPGQRPGDATAAAGHGVIAGQEAGPGGRLSELRRQHAACQADEARAFAACRQLQLTVDGFRAAKEAVEAAYLAAEQAAAAVRAELASPASGHQN